MTTPKTKQIHLELSAEYVSSSAHCPRAIQEVFALFPLDSKWKFPRVDKATALGLNLLCEQRCAKIGRIVFPAGDYDGYEITLNHDQTPHHLSLFWNVRASKEDTETEALRQLGQAVFKVAFDRQWDDVGRLGVKSVGGF